MALLLLLILFIDGSYSVFLGCLFFCLFKSFLMKFFFLAKAFFLIKVLFLTVSKIFVSSVFGFQGTILALLFHQPSKSTRPLWTFITVKLLLSGDGETRTLDPLLARQVLSQLSYTPVLLTFQSLYFMLFYCFVFLMGLNGLEPSTSRLSGVRSNQLSYKPFYM